MPYIIPVFNLRCQVAFLIFLTTLYVVTKNKRFFKKIKNSAVLKLVTNFEKW